jgi:hypothetical protein
MMVEPGHPVQRGDLHRFARLPRPAPVDQLGLVKPVDRLGQRVDAPMSRGRCEVPQIGKDQGVELTHDVTL